ncbi:MAG: penicillin-binding protein activator [Micavibrio sp.]|nr:penicillin-binding protein activator [Micavibrio sp.]
MTGLYKKILAPVQYLFVFAFVLLLSGCGGGTTAGWNAPAQGVVTNDPNSIPNMAWQTPGDRQDLMQQGKDMAAGRPGLVNAGALPKVKVAILLPMTGKNGDLGNAMFKAAQMALFDIGAGNFELVPKDTHSTSTGAADAARSAIADGAKLLLGPIFADDVRAVKPVASAANVPVVAFTTDWTIAGNDTYIMGFLPFAQVARVTQYAQAKGYSRFAVFAPQTPYCDAVISTLQRSNAQITKLERYAPSQVDVSTQAAAFAAAAKAPDGTFAFNSLVLPVGGENLRSLITVLSQQGITADNTKMIGTGLWDDASLTNDPSIYGGWFAAPDPQQRRDFEKRYQDNYGTAAPRLSTLAYDSTALAAVLARSGDANPFSRDRMTNARGFAGIDGIFRFRPDGLSERGLAVLEIQGGKARVIDPAPTAFLSSGS